MPMGQDFESSGRPTARKERMHSGQQPLRNWVQPIALLVILEDNHSPTETSNETPTLASTEMVACWDSMKQKIQLNYSWPIEAVR